MDIRHVALSLERDVSVWAELNNRDINDVYDEWGNIVDALIHFQVELNIPIMSVFMLRRKQALKNFTVMMQSLSNFLTDLLTHRSLLSMHHLPNPCFLL